MKKEVNEAIFAFVGEPSSPDSVCTNTGHGYGVFLCTKHTAIIDLFRSLCMWGGSTKTFEKCGNFYRYYELDCRDKEFFKSNTFRRICNPYSLKITIIEDGKELYNEFYSVAKQCI